MTTPERSPTLPSARVAAVALAAGESSRMGEPKALLAWPPSPWPDATLLSHAVLSALEAGYAPVVVVLGHRAEALRAHVPSGESVRIVVNERYAEGRATSIARGVAALEGEAIDGVLIASVDQPRSVKLLRTLREAWEAARPRPPLAAPTYGGKTGHPPLFDAALIPELLRVSEARQGLREVTSRHRAARLAVPSEDALATVNVNTPADYELALRLAGAG